jgi:hypothetical protein
VASLTPGTSIKHNISGNMRITFDNNTERTWSITRDREIGLTPTSAPFVRITGSGNDGQVIAGVNRNGKSFTTRITTAVEYNKAYGPWLPVSGVKVHSGLSCSVSITYGVDQNGNIVSGSQPYGFKVDWKNARGDSKSKIIAY